MATDLYKHYQESAINQSDPIRLVEMLYEGAIRFTRQAIKSIDQNDPEGAHNNILRTYAIVAELMATLDFDKGGDIAVHLEQCYDYVLFLLKEANIKKEKDQLEKVIGIIEPLLETWQSAFKNGMPNSGNNGDEGKKQPTSKDEVQEKEESTDRKPFDMLG